MNKAEAATAKIGGVSNDEPEFGQTIFEINGKVVEGLLPFWARHGPFFRFFAARETRLQSTIEHRLSSHTNGSLCGRAASRACRGKHQSPNETVRERNAFTDWD